MHRCYANVTVYSSSLLINTQNCASGHVAFLTLSVFIGARADRFNVEIMQSRSQLDKERAYER